MVIKINLRVSIKISDLSYIFSCIYSDHRTNYVCDNRGISWDKIIKKHKIKIEDIT